MLLGTHAHDDTTKRESTNKRDIVPACVNVDWRQGEREKNREQHQ